MIPGANILKMAQRVIASSTFSYYRFKERTQNAALQYIAVYETPLTLQGSVQPVPRNLYQEYGLDFERNYWNFFASADMIDIRRDVSGDYMLFKGMKMQCVSATPWLSIDGWVQMLSVEVPNE